MNSQEPACESCAEIYARLKAELDRLARAKARGSEWLRYSGALLAGVMQCQSIALEKQRLLLEALRAQTDESSVANLRRESKDALYCVEALTKLYMQVKQKLDIAVDGS